MVLSWLWPQVFVVSFQDSAEDLEQCLHMEWSVQNRKRAVPE